MHIMKGKLSPVQSAIGSFAPLDLGGGSVIAGRLVTVTNLGESLLRAPLCVKARCVLTLAATLKIASPCVVIRI